MVHSQILQKIAESFNENKVKTLLIGGQACVVYGAKTSTVDIDYSVHVDQSNLNNLNKSLKDLGARKSSVSVPLKQSLLAKGHYLHYYIQEGDFEIRIDLLGYLPQVLDFKQLWKRKYQYEDINIISLKDLVDTKKTGRLKDIVDIGSLLRSDFIKKQINPSPEDIEFWLLEAREEELIYLFVSKYKTQTKKLLNKRPLLSFALENNEDRLAEALLKELQKEKQIHKSFREPLVAEAKKIARENRRVRDVKK